MPWCEHTSPKCRLLAHLTCPPGSVTVSRQMLHLPLQGKCFCSTITPHLQPEPGERWHLGARSPARGSQSLAVVLATLRERAEP
ncbi:uncharacterized [Tachysurus ichikawai]